MNYDEQSERLRKLAYGYNLADKRTPSDWDSYLHYLDSLGENHAEAKRQALGILEVRAHKLNFKTEEVNDPKPEVKRYRTKIQERLASCQSLDDYIELANHCN